MTGQATEARTSLGSGPIRVGWTIWDILPDPFEPMEDEEDEYLVDPS